MRKKGTNRLYDQHTVWPKRRETSVTPELGGSAVPSELSEITSQRITLLSHDALSRPLPSGVNTRLETRSACPPKLASNFSVRLFHIKICWALHPDVMYRPSGLNRTDQR